MGSAKAHATKRTATIVRNDTRLKIPGSAGILARILTDKVGNLHWLVAILMVCGLHRRSAKSFYENEFRVHALACLRQ